MILPAARVTSLPRLHFICDSDRICTQTLFVTVAPTEMLELSVLSAVLQLGSNAYGVTISDAVNSTQGRDISLSRIYSALERLEDAGFITAHVSDATVERGNRPKRYYMITRRGSSRLLSDVSVNDYLVPA